MLRKSILILLTTSFFIGCGGDYDQNLSPKSPTPPKQNEKTKVFKNLGNKIVEVLGFSQLNFSNSSVSGTGDFVFADQFEKPNTRYNVKLDFNLQNSSSLKLVSFSDDMLNNGIELIFESRNDKLSITFKSNDSYENLDAFLQSQPASDHAVLSIEIQNDHGSLPQIFIWDLKTQELLFNNSVAGQGFGTHWGFKLEDSTLNQVEIREARELH